MTADQLPVRRALLSVSDKTGLVELARALAARNVELLSTGGTAKAIRDAGLAVRDVSEVTGFPEIMDGRVKTLHPKVHGGLLGRRGTDDAVMAAGIRPIDLLVLNLYPFEKVSADRGKFADIVENIDIGGPAMLRSGQNFAFVAVASIRPSTAPGGQLDRTTARCRPGPATRWRWRPSTAWPGTRPHQRRASSIASRPTRAAAAVRGPGQPASGVMDCATARIRTSRPRSTATSTRHGSLAAFSSWGKELSYNNIADATRRKCVRQFDAPACVIVNTPTPAAWPWARRGQTQAALRPTDQRLRRHHRLQPPLDAARRASSTSSSWVLLFGLQAGALEYAAKKATCASAHSAGAAGRRCRRPAPGRLGPAHADGR